MNSQLTYFTRNNLSRLLQLHRRWYSAQGAVKLKEDQDASKDIMKEYERLSNIQVKIRTKKPQKPPFMKNLFLGVYDTDILTYPQSTKEEVDKLNENIVAVKSLFGQLDRAKKPPDVKSDFMENARQLKLFGLQCSQLLDARELNVSESCRFSEIFGNNSSLAPGLVSNEYLGIQAILKEGSEDQKKKYLPALISGDCLMAFCMNEEKLVDVLELKTTAVPSSDGKTWILNGEKCFIINGSTADLMIVVAATQFLNRLGLNENKLTAFIVERGFGGVTSYPCDALGIEGSDLSFVQFKNTPVPSDNILGEVNTADSVLSSLLVESRLSTGSCCAAMLRKLSNNFIEYSKNIKSGSSNLTEAGFVKTILGEIALYLYAVESMTFLTAGLVDQYENQDCFVESAIVKAFSAQEACQAILNVMQTIGSEAYSKDHWSCSLYRDAISHLILNESSENLKLNIALQGIRHAGMNIQETVTIIRNPLFYPKQVLKRMWSQRKQNEDNPRLTLQLENYLHPSLQIGAERLEYCVHRLQFATETLLARYGSSVVSEHVELKRLAECAMDIYAMTASLGRASRAYCIGLEHANYEIVIADTFSLHAMERVKQKVLKIYNGPIINYDRNVAKISKRMFELGEYFPLHPTSRNF